MCCCFSQTACQKNLLTKTKVSYCFALDKANGLGRCIFCQKDSSAPLLDPCRNGNNTVCGYFNLKNNNEESQRSEVPFPVVIFVRLNELKEVGGVIQNLKKGKAK